MLHCTGDSDGGGDKSHLRQLLACTGGAETKLINKQGSVKDSHAKTDTHKYKHVQTHA